MKIQSQTWIAAAAAALILVACAAPAAQPTSSDISIKDAWARPTVGMAATSDNMSASKNMTSTMNMSGVTGVNSAAYMVIENKGGAADRLIGVSGDVAQAIGVHQNMQSDNGMMVMQPVTDGLEIPANGSVELKPGGYHIMLVNAKELTPGQTFKLTLKFKSGKEVPVDVTVREQ